MSVLISLAFGLTFDDLSANEQADFDPLVFSLAGSVLLPIFYAAAVVHTVASEYSSGMIRLTFTAVPRRERVLRAKMIVVWIATAITGTIALVGMLGLSQIAYKANDLPTASRDGDLWRLIIANAVLGQLITVLAGATHVPAPQNRCSIVDHPRPDLRSHHDWRAAPKMGGART